ncbi:MAG: alkaline shock response membrane anchor protein AmaP [Candidatus Omnitrophica bacterium]|nr:alkaline shock response membrane anchor protein AmaP [Candidatus Omnitrophota bacterium]
MRLFVYLGIVFYAFILILIGLVLIIFAFNILKPQDISNLISFVQYSTHSRIIIGLSGLLLILVSISFAQLILGRFQRERTIAFSTSSGEVTIALSAIEDLIKRLSSYLPEIRELRPDVIATKKGIIVDLRVILRSEANIPELTAHLQDITKSKMQEVLGIEEPIIIKIHIAKIVPLEDRDKKKKETEKQEPPIPFSGYTRL